MIAFEVFHNGRRVCIAGASDLCVLSTHITAAGKLGNETVPFHPDQTTGKVSLSVGGLTRRKNPKKDVHMNWLSLTKLKIGDVVEVRVTDTEKVDKPKTRKRRTEERRTARDR